jgi:hypothetical protein
VMKQVVGAPFTGLMDTELEDSIISAVSTMKPSTGLEKDCLDWIITLLKNLIGKELSVYLNSVVDKLLDPQVKLSWSAETNNCEMFCTSLLDTPTFGPLFSTKSSVDGHLKQHSHFYLMSVVCRPIPFSIQKFDSKLDVPYGFVEEYVLHYRYGIPESDIIDTLQEYWHDWAAMGKPPYQYQSLFPWVCNEAFGRNPVKCGSYDHNLAKHLLAFPFDSWSLISLHSQRDRHNYPPMSDKEWMQNRLLVLSAVRNLTQAAVAMAKNTLLRKRTSWLCTHSVPSVDRRKLGGYPSRSAM